MSDGHIAPTIDQETIVTPSVKKVFIETWGCQMNVADSEQMLKVLKDNKYVATENEAEADLFVLNTCHIREKSTHKVRSRLGTLRDYKRTNPNVRVAVTGCVAQAEGEKLVKGQEGIVDIVMGPGRISDFGQILQNLSQYRDAQVAVGFKPMNVELKSADGSETPTLSGRVEISRFVNIQQGCNNFCTFCVVPFTRGREISRTQADIVEEVRRFTASGSREITLLGQNVNSYGSDLTQNENEVESFVELLHAVSEVEDLWRLRFTTSNPHDFTPALANLFATHPKMGRYIHLPVQSGDDTVLERMKRKVTREDYLQRIAMLRKMDPEFSISTDLIVGFPGETEEQFMNTMSLVEQVDYSFIYSFKYSPRKGTAATRFADQIPEEEKDRRLQILNHLQDNRTIQHNLREVGRVRSVLFYYESKKEPGVFYGRTDQFRLVRARAGQNIIGRMLDVEIVSATKTALTGELVHSGNALLQ
jgi:tRNA-2-methylthio-N6-dimethylallyladenosine synthase